MAEADCKWLARAPTHTWASMSNKRAASQIPVQAALSPSVTQDLCNVNLHLGGFGELDALLLLSDEPTHSSRASTQGDALPFYLLHTRSRVERSSLRRNYLFSLNKENKGV